MKLESVYQANGRVLASTFLALWNLLSERKPYQNISHRKMPHYVEHISFVLSHPYDAWYLIKEGEQTLGATYLTSQGEIGISLFVVYKEKGYGGKALELLMAAHPRERYLANINPQNGSSIGFFESLGFKELQVTYELKEGKKCASSSRNGRHQSTTLKTCGKVLNEEINSLNS